MSIEEFGTYVAYAGIVLLFLFFVAVLLKIYRVIPSRRIAPAAV